MGDELESDRHLITIEEELKPWQPQSSRMPLTPSDAPIVPHSTSGGASFKPKFAGMRPCDSVLERRATPGNQSAHRAKLGKRKHLGSQTGDIVGFHRNELHRREVLEFEANTSEGARHSKAPCQAALGPGSVHSHSLEIPTRNSPRERGVAPLSRCGRVWQPMDGRSQLGIQYQQVKGLKMGDHTLVEVEGNGRSQPKTNDAPVAAMNTIVLEPNSLSSTNSHTSQTRRSLGQIMGLLRSKGDHPPPPPHPPQWGSAPASGSHSDVGVVSSELLPPPEVTTPTSFLEPILNHQLTSSRNCDLISVESQQTQAVVPPQLGSLPDVTAERELTEELPARVELESRVSAIKQSTHSRTLKPLTSRPEEFLTNQSDCFPLSTSQSNCSIPEAAPATTHTIVTLKPLVSSPIDFCPQTSQSDFSIQGDQRDADTVPTDPDQLECCVETVPSQQSPEELLVWDSLSEGSNWSEIDQSAGGMALPSDQSQLRDEPEEIIDLTGSQSSSGTHPHSQADQSDCSQDLEYYQLETTRLVPPVQPGNQLEHFTSIPNRFPAPQAVSARRKIGPRMLRKSKQDFNCPYAQWDPQPSQLETESEFNILVIRIRLIC